MHSVWVINNIEFVWMLMVTKRTEWLLPLKNLALIRRRWNQICWTLDRASIQTKWDQMPPFSWNEYRINPESTTMYFTTPTHETTQMYCQVAMCSDSSWRITWHSVILVITVLRAAAEVRAVRTVYSHTLFKIKVLHDAIAGVLECRCPDFSSNPEKTSPACSPCNSEDLD